MSEWNRNILSLWMSGIMLCNWKCASPLFCWKTMNNLPFLFLSLAIQEVFLQKILTGIKQQKLFFFSLRQAIHAFFKDTEKIGLINHWLPTLAFSSTETYGKNNGRTSPAWARKVVFIILLFCSKLMNDSPC